MGDKLTLTDVELKFDKENKTKEYSPEEYMRGLLAYIMTNYKLIENENTRESNSRD